MIVSNLKKMIAPALMLASLNAFAAIDGSLGSQIVNLNLQIKSKKSNSKSSLTMPFYQTAELERKIDNKNVLIELNPRKGKNADEIALEMRFYKASGSKAFYKKDIIAKLNQESKVTFRGTTVRVTPVLN